MDYYVNQAIRYLLASDDEKTASKNHWLMCFEENLKMYKSGITDSDCVNHAARIITIYAMMDNTPQESIITLLRDINNN